MNALEIHRLGKTYKRDGQSDLVAIRELTLSVRQGDFISIVGPSGCGKTTLLSCVAGLRPKTSGHVKLFGKVVNSPSRDIAVIFQEYGRTLLPWQRVLGNVIFGMENRPSISRRDYTALARDALKHVGLSDKEDAYPWQLSGGQQQRIAIARGLANGADILLMDEPFASVDAQTRSELEDLLLRIWAEYERTIVLVTHDVEEAIYMATKVVVLSKPPCVVLEEIEIDLGRRRNQMDTREDTKFLEYRRRIHSLLRPDQSQ